MVPEVELRPVIPDRTERIAAMRCACRYTSSNSGLKVKRCDIRPVASLVEVSAFAAPEYLIEIEAYAIVE